MSDTSTFTVVGQTQKELKQRAEEVTLALTGRRVAFSMTIVPVASTFRGNPVLWEATVEGTIT